MADNYKEVGLYLNEISKAYNFKVASSDPNGKKASYGVGREYRMQLINLSSDQTTIYKEKLPQLIRKNRSFTNVKYNKLSPNSSKFSSVSFDYNKEHYDVVIAIGANKGEKFEKTVIADLKSYFSNANMNINTDYAEMLEKLSKANKDFREGEITSAEKNPGSTKKEGIAISDLGKVIGDVKLTTSNGKTWYISLKDKSGDTLSTYPGAASIFNKEGVLQPDSKGAQFLSAFDVDLRQVQYQFAQRQIKNKIPLDEFDKDQRFKDIPKKVKTDVNIKNIFERAWGMNYFYVRRKASGYQVFWIDRDMLDTLSENITISKITYPSLNSKQISIFCGNDTIKYLVEIRNTHRGEYPDEIRVKILNISL